MEACLVIWLVLDMLIGSCAAIVILEHYGKNYDGVYRLSLENFMCGMFL